jgi:hypothetical protein
LRRVGVWNLEFDAWNLEFGLLPQPISIPGRPGWHMKCHDMGQRSAERIFCAGPDRLAINVVDFRPCCRCRFVDALSKCPLTEWTSDRPRVQSLQSIPHCRPRILDDSALHIPD